MIVCRKPNCYYWLMTLFRQNRRITAWFACLTILLNALAPAISHAMAAMEDDQTPWAQICSANGARFIPLDLNTDTPQQDRQPMAMDHCAYCLTHAGSFAVFSDVPLPVVSADFGLDYPTRFYQSPSRLFVWATASPRAPPVLS